MNTFSTIAIGVTIAAGLSFAAAEAHTSGQKVGGTPQSFHSELELRRAMVSRAWDSLGWKATPPAVRFNPVPNPEPISTGGTGTR